MRRRVENHLVQRQPRIGTQSKGRFVQEGQIDRATIFGFDDIALIHSVTGRKLLPRAIYTHGKYLAGQILDLTDGLCCLRNLPGLSILTGGFGAGEGLDQRRRHDSAFRRQKVRRRIGEKITFHNDRRPIRCGQDQIVSLLQIAGVTRKLTAWQHDRAIDGSIVNERVVVGPVLRRRDHVFAQGCLVGWRRKRHANLS